MPDLLLELFSEEIPARMQRKAAEDLRRLVTEALVERGLAYEGARAYATPRRLALHIAGLPAKGGDVREERRGPRVGAPEAAVRGFLKSAGLASLDQATIHNDPKKGAFHVAVIERPGLPTPDVLAELLPAVVKTFPWPKSMRWGAASAEPGSLRWVRPLHAIVCTFGPETEEPEVVRFAVDGIVAGDVTYGHRFMAGAAPIRVRRYDDYAAALEKAGVVLDAGRRKDIIRADANNLAFAQGLEVVEDEALLEEVAGLVEWPVVLMGTFDEDFLAIPPEVIRATIRANQKCFVLHDRAGKLSNRFILVANIEASDGGRAIAAGNARVVRARLSDARHFWRTDLAALPDTDTYREAARRLSLDLAKPLDQRMAKLDHLGVIFHEKLGTQGERVRRIAALARGLAPNVGADPDRAERAALLAKADLVTEMVGEFPELQGLMGRYYAAQQGEDPAVAAAIEDHYRPQGPSDRVPADPLSVAVALADKLDTLVGFWAIDEKPTGSKDPYALRRAALGVIRLVVENGVGINLRHFIEQQFKRIEPDQNYLKYANKIDLLLLFFEDRLSIQLRDQGARHDLLDAVVDAYSLVPGNQLLQIVRRVEALGRFLDTEDGQNLLAGTKRAANILRIEENKDGVLYRAAPDAGLFVLAEETALAAALATARAAAGAAIAGEDFAGAMAALSRLRAPVDAFFENVTVNADDPALRVNRLNLLADIREATRAVADFSKIEG